MSQSFYATSSLQLSLPMLVVGMIAQVPPMLHIGAILIMIATILNICMLPVEYNASERAMKLLQEGGYLTSAEEEKAVSEVLNAVAAIYVAAIVMGVWNLLRVSGSRRK